MVLGLDTEWNIKRKLFFRKDEQDEDEKLSGKYNRPENYKLLETMFFENENIVGLNGLGRAVSLETFEKVMRAMPWLDVFLGKVGQEEEIRVIPKEIDINLNVKSLLKKCMLTNLLNYWY